MTPPPPALPERYRAAWDRVCHELHADPEALGATISGSVLRGLGGPTSDLDVYVWINGAERWRRTYVCEGILIEEFRNSEPWIRRYVERRDDAPGLHMLGFGVVVLDRSPAFGALCSEARNAYELGPRRLSEGDALFLRYSVWDAWGDVKDLSARGDERAARGLIQREVHHNLAARYALEGRWLPKLRDLLPDVLSWDPPLAREICALWSPTSGDLAFSVAAYDRVVRHVLSPVDPDVPFTWTSARQPLA